MFAIFFKINFTLNCTTCMQLWTTTNVWQFLYIGHRHIVLLVTTQNTLVLNSTRVSHRTSLHLHLTMMATPARGDPAPHSFTLACPSWIPEDDEDTGFKAISTPYTDHSNPKWCGTQHAIAPYVTKIPSPHPPSTMHHHEIQ